jgi:hypothetical protein
MKWVLFRNGIKVAESNDLMTLMDTVDKDISTDETLYDIQLVEGELDDDQEE